MYFGYIIITYADRKLIYNIQYLHLWLSNIYIITQRVFLRFYIQPQWNLIQNQSILIVDYQNKIDTVLRLQCAHKNTLNIFEANFMR